MFLTEEPDLIVPFYNRNNKVVLNPKKTVLCFYSPDVDLYRRMENVINDIHIYKEYMGVIGLDITVTDDMDYEWQKFIMLLNQLFLAVLACNGIKIIMNARIGSPISIENFKAVPKNIIWATSFLGCVKLRSEADFSFISKVLKIMPTKLLIYGKHEIIAEKQLDNMGITFRIYADIHRLTKGVA